MQGLINKMRNILRDPSLPSRGLVPGTAKKTSSKRHIPGDLLPGHGRMRSGHQSPAGSLTSLYKHPTPAILVFLAVSGPRACCSCCPADFSMRRVLSSSLLTLRMALDLWRGSRRVTLRAPCPSTWSLVLPVGLFNYRHRRRHVERHDRSR